MAAEVIDPAALAREEYFNQPEGFPFEVVDIRDVLLPPNDDLGIPSDDDREEEDELQQETGFGSVVVVDGLPVVSEEKLQKLTDVVMKLFTKNESVIRDGGLCMPQDPETKLTKGFAFIEFSTPEEAQIAVQAFNNYKLDKKHTFTVNLFDALTTYSQVPDEYQPMETKPYEPKEKLWDFLMDPQGRDQFVVRYQSETEVYWNDARRSQPEQVYNRTYWTDSFVQWSPKGSMLATIHRQGVALWGRPNFAKLGRVKHDAVQLIDISPNEKFMVSYSSAPTRNGLQVVLNMWDLRSWKPVRKWQGPPEEFAVGTRGGVKGELNWPVFQWAGGQDDLFVAKLTKGAIQVYDCADMSLHDKKPYKLEAVQDFQWCPVSPVLCAFQTEFGNLPARVSLVKFPERQEIRQKNLFNVQDASIHWHPQGMYLAVEVKRYTKTKRSTYSGFELFRIQERDIPMDVLELPNKGEKIVAFEWEPKGHRFAIVHGDNNRPSLSFYSMETDKKTQGTKHIGTLANQDCDRLSWSPAGRHLIIAALKGNRGQLVFFNVDEMSPMNTGEHFMCTDIEWDPTGRYVATSVTSVQQMENGYIVWTYSGMALYKVMKDNFFQFSWRPRPPSLLPPEKEKEIAKNLKQYSKRYDEEDERLKVEADSEVVAARSQMMEEWKAWYESKQASIAATRSAMEDMLGDRLKELEYNMTEVEVEQVVDIREEPYNE